MVTRRSVARSRWAPAIPGIAATCAGYAGVPTATVRVHAATATQTWSVTTATAAASISTALTARVTRTIRSRRRASASWAVAQESRT